MRRLSLSTARLREFAVLAPADQKIKPDDRGAAMLHPKYRPDIDGLRAVAVLSVVVYHAFPALLPGGFAGVDIFFVISGYLITTIIAGNLQADLFSFADFYQRRIRRIFPALVLVVSAVFAFGAATLLADERERLEWHVVGAAGFVSNFILWGESGYFDAAADGKPLLHLWSLAIEEQFYLLWPALLWFAAKRRWRFAALTAVVGLASFALNLLLISSDAVATFYSPATRFWELLAGASLALSAHMDFRAPRRALSFAGLALLAASFAILHSARAFPGFWAVLPVAGAVAIIAAGPHAPVNRRLLSHPVLVWFGLISYPLYLWHWPLLSFARLLEGGSLWLRAAAVVAAVGLAWATTRFVERPLRTGDRGRLKAALLFGALIALGATAAGLQAARLLRGAEPVLPPAEAALQWREIDKSDPSCKRRFSRSYSYCKLGVEREPEVALVGDSFANAYYPGLAEVYAQRGQTLAMLGAPGCPPLLDISSGPAGRKDECRGRTSRALKDVAARPQIGVVILAANWSLYATGRRLLYPTPWEIRTIGGGASETNEIVFARQLGAALDLLTTAGKRVILLKQTPELPFDAAQCVRKALDESACRIDAAQAKAFLTRYETALEAVARAHPGVEIVDPVPALCGATSCPLLANGLPIFRDDLHLSRFGSALLARRIADRF